jgi:hypothetical protein
MSTVKISQLTPLSTISSNTQNTVFVAVDYSTGTPTTYNMTANVLASGLYANSVLNVGSNPVTLPNVLGQFSGSSSLYNQVNLQNFNGLGSGDFVITANNGTDTSYFINLGMNGSLYSDPTYSALSNNDGYLYVQGGASAPYRGNLIIGTASSGANIAFIVGGTKTGNIRAYIANSGIVLNSSNLIFSDGSVQSVAASPVAYSQAAYNFANTVNTYSYSAYAFANTVNTYSYSAYAFANTVNTYSYSAYAKANSALANATGVFAGDLTISGNVVVIGNTSSTGPITTGNLIVNGTSNLVGNVVMNAATYMTGGVTVNSTMVLANGNFTATDSALTITATPNVAIPSNDGYMIHISGKTGVSSRIVTDSYGSGSYVVYAGRSARGNVTNPSAVQTNDILSRFSGNGYGTTKYQQFGTARIDFVASENYTDANTGSQIQFWNCAVGTNTVTQIATFNGSSVTFTGAVYTQKGFIYNPLPYPGAQTAITIDFANNSVIKANTSAGVTVSFSNLTAGKVVEMWITNTAGTNQTFTHGCSALNSTVNSTTYNIPGTSTILARYMSFHTDTANVFVAVVR